MNDEMLPYEILYNILTFFDNEPHILYNLMLVDSSTRDMILEDPYKLLWSWLSGGVKYPSKEPTNWVKAANVFSNSNVGTHCTYYPKDTVISLLDFVDDEYGACYIIADEHEITYKIMDNKVYRCSVRFPHEYSDKHVEYPVDLILSIVSNEFMEGIYDEPMNVTIDSNMGYMTTNAIITRLKQGLIHCISYQLSNNIISVNDIIASLRRYITYSIVVLQYIKSIGINWYELPIYLSDLLDNVKDEQQLDYILSYAENIILVGNITCHYKYLIDVSDYSHVLKQYGITYEYVSQLIEEYRSEYTMNNLDFIELYIEGQHDKCEWMINNIMSNSFDINYSKYLLVNDVYNNAKNIITEILSREDIIDYLYSLSYWNEFYYLKWIMHNNILESYINRLEEDDRNDLVCRIVQCSTNDESFRRFIHYMEECVRK